MAAQTENQEEEDKTEEDGERNVNESQENQKTFSNRR